MIGHVGGYGFSLIVIMFHLVIGEPEPEDTENLRNSKLCQVLCFANFIALCIVVDFSINCGTC